MKKWIAIVLFLFINTTHASTGERPVLNFDIILTVDWEGYSLDPANLSAFSKFRDQHPEIKLVHFLNAAYFTKSGADAADIVAKIKSVLRPGDDYGLHLHALENLVIASGVKFRDGQTFWGDSESKAILGQRGHDIPLSLFSVDELRKLIRTSLSILSKNGFKDIHSFRAGGWIASSEVLEALVHEGITIDSSAVSSEFVGLLAGPEMPLYTINKKLWPDQNFMRHEPYQIQTPAGPIVEVPNNIALADYIDDEKAFELFDELYVKNLGRKKNVNFNFGFHQESAAAFLPRLERLLKKIATFQQQYMVTTASRTFSEMDLKDFTSIQKTHDSCQGSMRRSQ